MIFRVSSYFQWQYNLCISKGGSTKGTEAVVSTIGFMGLALGLIRGSMAVWRGCGSWGQRSFRKPLDSEMPPPSSFSSRGIRRDGAGLQGLWLCSVDVMAWMSFFSSIEEVYRWDPTCVSAWM